MMHGLDEIAASPALAADLTPAEAMEQLGKIAAIQLVLWPRALQRQPVEEAAPDPTDTLSLDEVVAQLNVTRTLLIRNRRKFPFVKQVSRKNFVVVESRYRAWLASRS
jgi:hypothetical protein